MSTGEASNVRVAVSVSLSFVNGTMSNSNITTAETVTPYVPALQNTLFYTATMNTSIFCNLTYFSTGFFNINTAGCFLKAMRIA